jgi:hypothetical protein
MRSLTSLPKPPIAMKPVRKIPLQREIVQTLIAAARMVESEHNAEERRNGHRVLTYAKEKRILLEAKLSLDLYQPIDRTREGYNALFAINQAIEDRFVASAECQLMRRAETSHEQEVHQNAGLHDAIIEVISPLQFLGTEAERIVAKWFFDRYVDRLQADLTGAAT